MKNKILTLLAIFIFLISIMSVNSFAIITSANASLSVEKSSYNLDEEDEVITVTLRLDNLKSNNGIIAYSAVLEYDKNKLTYLDCSGSGAWPAPSYSDENGKLVADRANNDFSADGEVLCTIRFKPKSAGENIVIKLSNIELSSGEIGGGGLKQIDDAQVAFSIKSSTQPSVPGGEDDPSKPSNSPDPSNPGSDEDDKKPDSDTNNDNNGSNKVPINSSKNDKSDNNPNTSKSIIPKLGVSTYILITIGIVCIVAIVFFARMKLLDRKIKKEAIKHSNDKK